MKPYVGIKENCKPEIFESEPLTDKVHPQYDIIYGPFNSREDAERYIKAMGNLACGQG